VVSLAAAGLMLGSPPTAAGGDENLLGMSTALSVPAAELGENMKTGVLAALEEANRGGGVAGRSLRLVALDDQYEPAQTGPNMLELIDDKAGVAVVDNVGTPTAVDAIPIASETKTPFYGAIASRSL
jgi:ABC-type branched-subunit amino acid transport system substrate-binding protein